MDSETHVWLSSEENQLMDLGIVIVFLFAFVQNNAKLSTLFITMIQAVQTQLPNLIT